MSRDSKGAFEVKLIGSGPRFGDLVGKIVEQARRANAKVSGILIRNVCAPDVK